MMKIVIERNPFERQTMLSAVQNTPTSTALSTSGPPDDTSRSMHSVGIEVNGSHSITDHQKQAEMEHLLWFEI